MVSALVGTLASALVSTVLSGLATGPAGSHQGAPIARSAHSASVAAAPLLVGLPVNPWEATSTALTQTLDQAQQAGVTVVQSAAVWPTICPTATTCDFSPLDRLVVAARARGLQVALQVSQTPDWVHPAQTRTAAARAWTPPAGSSQLATFTAFVQTLSARFAGRVRSYEIWNEPDLAEFFRPGVDATAYAGLLRAGWTGVRAGDPAALVVSGGLARGDLAYLRALYGALAQLPDAASNGYYNDLVGLHPYSGDASPDYADTQGALVGHDTSYAAISTAATVLAQVGDPRKRLWLGEYGFSTTATWMPAVPDRRRALYLMRAFDIASASPRVAGLVWYAYRPDTATASAWTMTSATGATSTTYAALEAWSARAASTAGSPIAALAPSHVAPGWRPGQPAGLRAKATVALTGAQTVTAAGVGADPARTAGMEVWVDGRLVASSDQPEVSWDTADVTEGPHRLLAAAYASDGSAPVYAAPATVTVAHPAAGAISVVALTLPSTAQAGAPVTVTATVRSGLTMVAEDLVVAVRSVPAQAHSDFTGLSQIQVGPTGYTWSGSRSFPAGTYRVFVAYRSGTTWTDLTPQETLTVT